MKKINILISGAGGPTAINIIKSLKGISFAIRITAIDSNPLSPGFYKATNSYVVPKANDELFMKEIYKIITREKIELIMPTSGFDIIPLSKSKKRLSEMLATCFFSDYNEVNLCNDKYEFYRKIRDDFPTPKVFFYSNRYDYPVFIKPIRGKGSRNSYLCESKSDVDYIMNRHEDMMICEYLPGIEYTIDVLSDLDGRPICAIPRERIQTKAGISFKGRVVKNKKIQDMCMSLAEYIGLKGPSCMQMKQDKEGKLKFVEVNPRMGGGTIMATLAGVNIPRLILKLYRGERINEGDLMFREITVLRYYEEIVLQE